MYSVQCKQQSTLDMCSILYNWSHFSGKYIKCIKFRKEKTKIGLIELIYVIVIVTLFVAALEVRHRPDPTQRQKNPLPPVTSFSPTDQIHQHTWPDMGNSRPVLGGHRWAEVINVLLFLWWILIFFFSKKKRPITTPVYYAAGSSEYWNPSAIMVR